MIDRSFLVESAAPFGLSFIFDIIPHSHIFRRFG
jgi:hypothetical protein